jgi:sugar/nucleoside kinase (ribokinase family)
MLVRELHSNRELRFTHVIGIGGIGAGDVFALQGDHTLGRDESRLASLLNARDYCKSHIVEHYIATMMGAKADASTFHASAIGVVGEDATGDQLLLEMKQVGINTKRVRRDAGCRTPTASGSSIRIGRGNTTASNSAATTLNEENICRGAELMKSLREQCVALCLPEVALEIRHSFLRLATEARNFRVASFVRAEIAVARTLDLFSLIDLLAVNVEEAPQIVGYACSAVNSNRFLLDCSTALTHVQPKIQIVVSAGAEGAYAFEDGRWSYCSAPTVPVVSTAGAGDALLAGIVCGLSVGLPLTYFGCSGQALSGSEIHSAVELGLLLVSFSVTSPHTIHFEANPNTLARFAPSLAHRFEESAVRAADTGSAMSQESR